MTLGRRLNRTCRKNRPGPRRADDRRILSGIIHVLKSGCRWKDCPPEYGPPTTVYNRFNRWSGRDHWWKILAALAEGQWITTAVAMDGRDVKAHRCAHGGKGGPKIRRWGSQEAGKRRANHKNPRAERYSWSPYHLQGDGGQCRRY